MQPHARSSRRKYQRTTRSNDTRANERVDVRARQVKQEQAGRNKRASERVRGWVSALDRYALPTTPPARSRVRRPSAPPPPPPPPPPHQTPAEPSLANERRKHELCHGEISGSRIADRIVRAYFANGGLIRPRLIRELAVSEADASCTLARARIRSRFRLVDSLFGAWWPIVADGPICQRSLTNIKRSTVNILKRNFS